MISGEAHCFFSLQMHFFGALSITSQVPFSSIIWKRRKISYSNIFKTELLTLRERQYEFLIWRWNLDYKLPHLKTTPPSTTSEYITLCYSLMGGQCWYCGKLPQINECVGNTALVLKGQHNIENKSMQTFDKGHLDSFCRHYDFKRSNTIVW